MRKEMQLHCRCLILFTWQHSYHFLPPLLRPVVNVWIIWSCDNAQYASICIFKILSLYLCKLFFKMKIASGCASWMSEIPNKQWNSEKCCHLVVIIRFQGQNSIKINGETSHLWFLFISHCVWSNRTKVQPCMIGFTTRSARNVCISNSNICCGFYGFLASISSLVVKKLHPKGGSKPCHCLPHLCNMCK